MDKELYSKLITLKSRLKQNFYANGRAPMICSDEALADMATNVPKKKSDLYAIEGIGDTFVEKYGDYFMLLFDEYNNKHTKIFDNDIKLTLSNLENRLVNISQSNKLLYIGRLYSKFAVDLFCENNCELNSALLDLVYGKKSKVVLCNTKNVENQDREIALYKKVNILIREINKQYKETGEFCMYIAYPFVVGYSKKDDFRINAPLMLFPVTYEKTNDKITLKKDISRDILYNTNLILLKNKLECKNQELPDSIVQDFDATNLIFDAIEFYKNNGIEIKDAEDKNISKFIEYSEKTFPKNILDFTVSYKMVLGKFSLCDSAIGRDYKKLIASNRVNELVEKLITDIDGIDFYADAEQNVMKSVKYDENNIFYINDLNASQESAISQLTHTDELVIQGPPGTGKSQTITSIVSDFVCKDKNVLVVSQKKVALEVIYSRLQELSKYAILLSNGGDKNSFYDQLYRLLSFNEKMINYQSKIDAKNNEIEAISKEFEKMQDILYAQKTNATDVLTIYNENIDNFFLNNTDKLMDYFNKVDAKFLQADYKVLKDLRAKFDDKSTLDNFIEYLSLNVLYPWLKIVKKSLLAYSKNAMLKDIEEFCMSQKNYLNSSIIKKLFTNFKRKKILKNILNQYFINNQNFKYLYKNPDKLYEGIQLYDRYIQLCQQYEKLSDIEKNYLSTIYALKEISFDEVYDINNKLFDFIIYCILQNFETFNPNIVQDINDYYKMHTTICELMHEKSDLVKKQAKSKLISGVNFIKNSKRFPEIARLCENKHKRDIKRFVDKFAYELLKGIKIWLLTPETVSEILPLTDGLFDVVVFDEASQIYIERSLPTIFRGKKVVVSGDHKQLRPSSLGFGRIDTEEDEFLEDEDIKSALDEESLLDLARFKYPQIMLNYHYRAKYQELIEFSNHAFYKGNLNISPNVSNEILPPIEVIKINDGFWEKRANKNEALRVVELIKDIFKNRKNNETIGVVTFNISQQDLILDLLEKECMNDSKFASSYRKECDRTKDGEDVGLFVKNIENVQGDERDIVIFSIAYAKNETGKVVRNFGWLNQKAGENRLNVAISRAKRKIYIVTSILPSELIVDDLKNDGPKFFKKYLEYAFAISNNDMPLAKSILNSFGYIKDRKDETLLDDVKMQIYNALVENNEIVEKDIGIGNYVIDLAVKDKNTNNYLLAIEFAKDLYEDVEDMRERDIHRQNFLNTRGFTTYRVWVNNYYHNPEKEIKNILNMIHNH